MRDIDISTFCMSMFTMKLLVQLRPCYCFPDLSHLYGHSESSSLTRWIEVSMLMTYREFLSILLSMGDVAARYWPLKNSYLEMPTHFHFFLITKVDALAVLNPAHQLWDFSNAYCILQNTSSNTEFKQPHLTRHSHIYCLVDMKMVMGNEPHIKVTSSSPQSLKVEAPMQIPTLTKALFIHSESRNAYFWSAPKLMNKRWPFRSEMHNANTALMPIA